MGWQGIWAWEAPNRLCDSNAGQQVTNGLLTECLFQRGLGGGSSSSSSEIEAVSRWVSVDKGGELAVLQKSNQRKWVEIDEIVKLKVKDCRQAREIGNRKWEMGGDENRKPTRSWKEAEEAGYYIVQSMRGTGSGSCDQIDLKIFGDAMQVQVQLRLSERASKQASGWSRRPETRMQMPQSAEVFPRVGGAQARRGRGHRWEHLGTTGQLAAMTVVAEVGIAQGQIRAPLREQSQPWSPGIGVPVTGF